MERRRGRWAPRHSGRRSYVAFQLLKACGQLEGQGLVSARRLPRVRGGTRGSRRGVAPPAPMVRTSACTRAAASRGVSGTWSSLEAGAAGRPPLGVVARRRLETIPLDGVFRICGRGRRLAAAPASEATCASGASRTVVGPVRGPGDGVVRRGPLARPPCAGEVDPLPGVSSRLVVAAGSRRNSDLSGSLLTIAVPQVRGYSGALHTAPDLVVSPSRAALAVKSTPVPVLLSDVSYRRTGARPAAGSGCRLVGEPGRGGAGGRSLWRVGPAGSAVLTTLETPRCRRHARAAVTNRGVSRAGDEADPRSSRPASRLSTTCHFSPRFSSRTVGSPGRSTAICFTSVVATSTSRLLRYSAAGRSSFSYRPPPVTTSGCALPATCTYTVSPTGLDLPKERFAVLPPLASATCRPARRGPLTPLGGLHCRGL